MRKVVAMKRMNEDVLILAKTLKGFSDVFYYFDKFLTKN